MNTLAIVLHVWGYSMIPNECENYSDKKERVGHFLNFVRNLLKRIERVKLKMFNP